MQSKQTFQVLARLFNQFRTSTVRGALSKWQQKAARSKRLELIAGRVQARLRARTFIEMQRIVRDAQHQKTLERQKGQLVQLSAVSKRVVALTTLLSRINTNHKLTVALAFKSLQGQPKAGPADAEGGALGAKLGRMCAAFERLETRRLQKLNAFQALQAQGRST